jgi:hypothetical protein
MPTRSVRRAHTAWFPVSSVAWTPASITGVVSWYDATNAASITASSGAVSQWNDLVSTNHLTQPTGTNQPITGTATINSLNTINFDGINDWMAVTFTALSPCSVLMVSRTVSGTAGTWHDSNDAASRTQTFISGGIAVYAGSVVATGHAISANETLQFVSVFNGASSVLYKGGAAGSTNNPGAQTLHGLTIGADSSRAGPFSGVYGEIVVVNGVISSGDRTSWNTYCARWGL